MNRLTLVLLALLYVGWASCSAFFSQREILFLDDDVEYRPLYLKRYFNSKPKLFGLVSDKKRKWEVEGYLCRANSISEYNANCKGKHPNYDWVTTFILLYR